MERNENGAYLLDPAAVAEWLSGGVEEVSHETTDAAIEALADRIFEEAAA